MRRALVTGATGGLGGALVATLLSAGYIVRATGRDLAAGVQLQATGAEFVPAELRDASTADTLTSGVDAVFHAAALSGPWGRPADFEAVNVTATRFLLAAADRAGCDTFIFISTPSVYAEARDRVGLTEASPLARRFANAYTASKHRAERLVLTADRPGFAGFVLRPRALIGPGDKVLLPRLLRVARSGRFPLFHGGRALIDLTDMQDAAEAALAADRYRSSVPGRVFNISSGAPASVAEILAELFGALGLRPKLIALPYAPAALLARTAEAVCAALPGRPEPPATAYTLSTLAFSQTFNLAAARAGLRWSPRFTPQQAIARTAAQWGRHAPP
jgi:nucleoside-diphosphate-sugar epimerase